MARRRRLLPDLRISAPSVVACILAWARDATDFRPSINGAGGACASRHMVWGSVFERWRDGAGSLPDLRTSAPLGRCTHIGVGARRDRFSTIDERGRRCLREPAHGLQEQPRAMARRRRRLPDLGISVPSGFARILVWARDATDSRLSMNGVGGAGASRHINWGSVFERWSDGAGSLLDLRISAPSGFARILVWCAQWASDATDSDHR